MAYSVNGLYKKARIQSMKHQSYLLHSKWVKKNLKMHESKFFPQNSIFFSQKLNTTAYANIS